MARSIGGFAANLPPCHAYPPATPSACEESPRVAHVPARHASKPGPSLLLTLLFPFSSWRVGVMASFTTFPLQDLGSDASGISHRRTHQSQTRSPTARRADRERVRVSRACDRCKALVLRARDWRPPRAIDHAVGRRSDARERSRVPCAVGWAWTASSMRVTLVAVSLPLNRNCRRSHRHHAFVRICQSDAGLYLCC